MRPILGRTTIALALCGAALALATGCGRPPATRYYTLDPREAAPPASQGVTIGVLPFAVDAPYDQDRIVYRIGESTPEVGFYDYHRWAVPLSRMLPRFVAAGLGGADGVGRIEPASSDLPYDLRLTGRVRVLEEVDTAAGQHVRVDIELALLDADGDRLWSGRVTGRTERSADTVAALVGETRDLIETLMADRRQSLVAALRGVRP